MLLNAVLIVVFDVVIPLASCCARCSKSPIASSILVIWSKASPAEGPANLPIKPRWNLPPTESACSSALTVSSRFFWRIANSRSISVNDNLLSSSALNPTASPKSRALSRALLNSGVMPGMKLIASLMPLRALVTTSLAVLTIVCTTSQISPHSAPICFAARTNPAMASTIKPIGPVATVMATPSAPTPAIIAGNAINNGPITSISPPMAAAAIPSTLTKVGCASLNSITFAATRSRTTAAFSTRGINTAPSSCATSPRRFLNCVMGSAAASACPPATAITAANRSVKVAVLSTDTPVASDVFANPAKNLESVSDTVAASRPEKAAASSTVGNAWSAFSWSPKTPVRRVKTSRCFSSPKLVLRCWASMTRSIAAFWAS